MDRYVATGPIDVGSADGEVAHYDDGDEVLGAGAFENLADLVAVGRLRKKAARAESSGEPAKPKARRSRAAKP